LETDVDVNKMSNALTPTGNIQAITTQHTQLNGERSVVFWIWMFADGGKFAFGILFHVYVSGG
jgi:hypothetical protein